MYTHFHLLDNLANTASDWSAKVYINVSWHRGDLGHAYVQVNYITENDSD